MDVRKWAPVDFGHPHIPVPTHTPNAGAFELPLRRYPPKRDMTLKPCYIWVHDIGEHIRYEEWDRWENEKRAKRRKVDLSPYFRVTADDLIRQHEDIRRGKCVICSLLELC